MKWYPWLQPHFRKLISNYQLGRWHHALLVQAAPGMGDEMLIYAIACFLTCWKTERYESCGKCRSCHLMKVNAHPDFYILKSEKEKAVIGIDTVREVNDKLYECSKLGGAKVVWITDASLLTEAAVNAFLKILEEPPNQTWFFLSCCEPKRLLATLRSRCRLYYLTVPKETCALSWLNRNITTSKEVAITALRIYGGAPIAALSLLEKTIYSRREQFCLLLAAAIKNQDYLSLLSEINNSKAPDYLYWLVSLLLDALKMRYGITLISNIDNRELVVMLAKNFSTVTLLSVIHNICNCREQLLTIIGINRELILINQLLYIADCVK